MFIEEVIKDALTGRGEAFCHSRAKGSVADDPEDFVWEAWLPPHPPPAPEALNIVSEKLTRGRCFSK